MMTCATLLLASLMANLDDAGKPVEGFRLQDGRGGWHSLDDAKGKKVVVLAFLGVECPVADQYASRLADLSKAIGSEKVTFFGIDSNCQDAPTAMVRFAESHSLPFPLLKDVGNVLADRLKVTRTPEVLVLDENRVVRYHGRVDDQFGVGVHRPSPTRKDLSIALDEILAGKAVSEPRTEVVGCLIGRAMEKKADASITYGGHIARILRQRCVSCHREGEIAPFSLTTYDQAYGWSEMIAEVVSEGRMPPWHANPKHGKFSNDARLSGLEKQQIKEWVAAGAPEGTPIKPLTTASTDVWRIGKPDLIVSMPEVAQIPSEGSVPYQNFLVDLKLDHDIWVQATQIRPGNPSVVHHVIAYVIAPGDQRIDLGGAAMLAPYAPGMPPRIMPEGVAKKIPAGSKMMFQMHYTPRGTPETDRSSIGLKFADVATVRRLMLPRMAIQMRLKIPAETADYQETAEMRFEQDYILYTLMPHMHLRGKAMTFEATYPDGRTEVLLDVPRYDFDWQNVYVLKEPKRMPEGTVIRCTGTFDNSADNPNNPNPKATVRFGEQTNDEMLVGYMDVALADQDLTGGKPVAKARPDGKFDVTFHHKAPEGTKAVSLVGTFNEWKDDAQKMAGPDAEGRFSTTVVLAPGHHEYKFLLDGKKHEHDRANPKQAGIYNNSVLDLKAP